MIEAFSTIRKLYKIHYPDSSEYFRTSVPTIFLQFVILLTLEILTAVHFKNMMNWF